MPSRSPTPTTPAALRARIIAFLKGKPPTGSDEIRAHLGLPRYEWLPVLNQALKSRRIRVTKAYVEIGKHGKTTLLAATPISLYSLNQPSSL